MQQFKVIWKNFTDFFCSPILSKYVISIRLFEICKIYRLPLLPSEPLGVWGSLPGNTPTPKMSLKMKIIAKGKRTVGVTRYLKAKFFPTWPGPGQATKKRMFSK